MVSTAPDWLEPLVRFLANPLVSPLLLSLGVLGLVLEIKTGAFGLGGLVSLVSLGLFFASSFLVGLGGWEEIILLGIGLVAISIEVFILPGFGAAGIVGIVALAAAVVLAMIGSSPSAADVTQAFTVLGVSVAITAAVTYAWLRHLPNSGRFGGLFLRGGAHQADGYIAATPRHDLVGQDGIAVPISGRPAPRRSGTSGWTSSPRASTWRRAGRSGWCGAKGIATWCAAFSKSVFFHLEDLPVDESMLSLGVVLALAFIAVIILVIFFQFIPFGLWLTALFSGIRVPFFTCSACASAGWIRARSCCRSSAATRPASSSSERSRGPLPRRREREPGR
jgi:Membrane-bound serine protease (ClpP class)